MKRPADVDGPDELHFDAGDRTSSSREARRTNFLRRPYDLASH
jgi:hypothetical protein